VICQEGIKLSSFSAYWSHQADGAIAAAAFMVIMFLMIATHS
jgi:hypothetical protein